MTTGNFPRKLSANFEEDFAYATLKDRLPIIVTKVIDSLYRLKNFTAEKFPTYNEIEVKNDLKHIVGLLAKTKNELQTNKQLLLLDDGWSDVAAWNEALQVEQKTYGNSECKWFTVSWLFSECYFYRRMFEAVQTSVTLKSYDLFGDMKRNSFTSSILAMESLANHLETMLETGGLSSVHMRNKDFFQLLQVCLWGNKCDLSISAAHDNAQQCDPLTELLNLQSHIVVNDEELLWQYIKSSVAQMDFVLDNAGFELFCDLCFADFLITAGFVKHIRFHCKSIPWFVSDVTVNDWKWTMQELAEIDSLPLQQLGRRWLHYMENHTWTLEADSFWTLPYDFSNMSKVASKLYDSLMTSQLIIFKGDLNYRKLTGDRKWLPSISFDYAMCGFSPAPLCALRTLKSDLVTGMPVGVAESLNANSSNWMTSGDYAVIQCNQLVKNSR